MGSPHRDLQDSYAADHTIPDPGTGKSLEVTLDCFICNLVSTTTETRTLPAPAKEGLQGTICGKTVGGAITLTITGGYEQGGDTTLVFDTNGDWVKVESINVNGTVRWAVVGYEGVTGTAITGGSVVRADIQAETVAQPIPIRNLYVWDAPWTNPVSAGANDDLALIYNTFGTAGASVESGDSKAATTTRRIGFQLVLPPEYKAGTNITLRLSAGMKTTVSDTTATIDVEAYAVADPTTDLCATAAQSINSLTKADKDFTLTGTNLVPGSVIDCRVTMAIVDGATGTAVIGKWYLGDAGSGARMSVQG